MTLEEARCRAERMAVRTGEPVVVFRDPGSGWDIWHTLDAAKWLAEDGELVFPARLADPERVEGELRARAQTVRGHARRTLLEGVMRARAEQARRRICRRAVLAGA